MRSIDREQQSRVSSDPSQGELVNNFDEPGSESEEETDWTSRPERNNEKLTEDHLVAAAVNYSHGELPLMNQILCLNDPDLRALDHVPVMQRSILHPILALKILYYRMVRWLGRRNFVEFLPLAKTDLQFLWLVFVYALLSSENLLLFLPMLVYYVSFGAMVVFTFQMLQAKRDYGDFRVWSGLFITYSGGELNTEEVEFQFIRNNLRPYGHFFLALLVNLMVYPLIAEQWIPQSELTVAAFCLTFMTLFGFMTKNFSKTLVLFSFAVNVIAKYPYETDLVVTQGWRFLDLKIPSFAGYIVGNGIDFCINFRLLFYIFIPLLLIQMAVRENCRGTYKILIPHCVTLSWLQIVIICSQGATMFGLLRATLALVGIVLFLPMVGLTTLILPAAALAKWLATNITYSIFVFLTFLLVGLLVCWIVAKGRYQRFTGIVQMLFTLTAFVLVFNMDLRVPDFEAAEVKPLSWEVYQKFCHQPSWEKNNMAVTQRKCVELDDVKVSWEGYVNHVKIESMSNPFRQFFDKLPRALSDYLYCLYGEEVTNDCDETNDLLKDDCLQFHDSIKSKRKCSLAKHNKYSFEISVRMKSGMWGKTAESALILDNTFTNFSFALQVSDHIWFKGLLKNQGSSEGILGGTKPHVVVEELGCLDCHNLELTRMKIKEKREVKADDVLRFLYLGVKCVLNFLFSPVVVFK